MNMLLRLRCEKKVDVGSFVVLWNWAVFHIYLLVLFFLSSSILSGVITLKNVEPRLVRMNEVLKHIYIVLSL